MLYTLISWHLLLFR